MGRAGGQLASSICQMAPVPIPMCAMMAALLAPHPALQRMIQRPKGPLCAAGMEVEARGTRSAAQKANFMCRWRLCDTACRDRALPGAGNPVLFPGPWSIIHPTCTSMMRGMLARHAALVSLPALNPNALELMPAWQGGRDFLPAPGGSRGHPCASASLKLN